MREVRLPTPQESGIRNTRLRTLRWLERVKERWVKGEFAIGRLRSGWYRLAAAATERQG
jgi:hypothetical protein